MTLVIYLSIVLFLVGLYFYAKTANPKYFEGLTNGNVNKPRCPNMLIQKGSSFYLYNSKLAQVPGVNPVEFDNLEDYVEFLDWQKSQSINCPVLFLQQTYDAQGNEVYKVRPRVTEQQGGLPPAGSTYPNPTLLVDATRNDPPYNINSFPAYDQENQDIGSTTPLDGMNIIQKNLPVSPDPMDANWGGAQYTQSLIDKGYYANNNVALYVGGD